MKLKLFFLFIPMLVMADTPMRYAAVCELTCVRDQESLKRISLAAPCVLEDMPAPNDGFNNRFRILVRPQQSTNFHLPTIFDYVRVAATRDGFTEISATLWGELTIKPLDPHIRNLFRSAEPPGFEVRPQRITMSWLDGSTIEILIEERWEDFNGRSALKAWREGHEESLALFSAAK